MTRGKKENMCMVEQTGGQGGDSGRRWRYSGWVTSKMDHMWEMLVLNRKQQEHGDLSSVPSAYSLTSKDKGQGVPNWSRLTRSSLALWPPGIAQLGPGCSRHHIHLPILSDSVSLPR